MQNEVDGRRDPWNNLPLCGQQKQHGHPYRNPIFNLLQNDGVVRIGHIAGDFHSPIDGARVHDHNFFIQGIQQLAIDAEVLGILPQGWEILDVLAFQLNA